MKKLQLKVKKGDLAITAESKAVDERLIPDSRQQPAWHVIVLGCLTFLSYYIYWFYKNWRDLKMYAVQQALNATLEDRADAPAGPDRETLAVLAKASPGLQTLGMIVPMLNIYLGLTFVLRVASLVPSEKSFVRKHPFFAAIVIVAMALVAFSLTRLPGYFSYLWMIATIPFAIVQHWINQFWRSVETGEVRVRYAFTLKEMIVIVLGAIVGGLNTAGMMIGLKPH